MALRHHWREFVDYVFRSRRLPLLYGVMSRGSSRMVSGRV